MAEEEEQVRKDCYEGLGKEERRINDEVKRSRIGGLGSR